MINTSVFDPSQVFDIVGVFYIIDCLDTLDQLGACFWELKSFALFVFFASDDQALFGVYCYFQNIRRRALPKHLQLT
jgi:hypothetical protein